MSRKAVIVEDQPDIRKLIMMTLEFEEFELHEAENGAEGWRLVQAVRPHLILLDVMMPGELDGYQVCRKVKDDPVLGRQSRVILLSARGQQSDIEQGWRAGCDAYMTKPFSPLELLENIDRLVTVTQ